MKTSFAVGSARLGAAGLLAAMAAAPAFAQSPAQGLLDNSWVINAGMWGCRNDQDIDFRALIRDYLAANDDPGFLAVDQCFLRDVIYPLARKFGELATKFTPQNALQNTAHKLELAGNPRGIDPTVFWAARFIAVIVVGGLFLFLFSIGASDWPWSRKLLILAAGVSSSQRTISKMCVRSRIASRLNLVRSNTS